MNVLISDASSYKAIVIAKFLKDNYDDIRVFTCDTRPITKFLHTKYSDGHTVLKVDAEKNYTKEVIELAKKLNVDLYIPVNSRHMGNLIKFKDDLGKAANYWGSYEQFITLNEKDKLYEYAQKLDIKIPKGYRNLEEANVPFIIKPTNESSAKGVIYVMNENDLSYVKNLNLSKCVIQEYIKGIGVGYSVFAKDGEIITGYGHKRLAEYPITGGSSVYRTGYEHPDAIAITKKVIKNINWSGFGMFEFKLTDNNAIYLIEVNPRIWGSINQGLQNGTNYFENLLGKPNKIIENKKEINTFLSPLMYLSLIEYCLNGDFKHLITFIKSIGINKADVSFVEDPLGWISLSLRMF